jgi:hypothetical protein
MVDDYNFVNPNKQFKHVELSEFSCDKLGAILHV